MSVTRPEPEFSLLELLVLFVFVPAGVVAAVLAFLEGALGVGILLVMAAAGLVFLQRIHSALRSIEDTIQDESQADF